MTWLSFGLGVLVGAAAMFMVLLWAAHEFVSPWGGRD